MKCSQARKALTASTTNGAARRHAGDCEPCARFARRLAEAERSLAAHHLEVSPTTGFAARISSRIHADENILGWAALRLLPATLGLVLLLSWLNLRDTMPVAATQDPTDAVLNWMLDPIGESEDDS